MAEREPGPTLRKVVEISLTLVDRAEHAGVAVVDHEQIRTVAHSDDVVALIDTVQSAVGEGPCLSAQRDGDVVHCNDLETEQPVAPVRRPGARGGRDPQPGRREGHLLVVDPVLAPAGRLRL